MLTGQNGILNRASDAKEKTEESSKDEQRKLAQAEALMSTEKTTYKGVTLPEGFAPTKIDGEDSVDDGLVITDGYGNEYVWVEVPKTDEVYPTAGLSITTFTDDEYGKIEDDLHKYTSDYRNGTNYSDTYAPDGTTGWFKEEKEYDNAKRKMLKSVYENGGFWIGRYEAGIESEANIRNDKGDANIIPISKVDAYPYVYVTRTQAKALAEKVESGSYTSSLMFGVQWDLTLKYIENKMVKTDKDIKEKLNSNSTTIGNYLNSVFVLNRGKYAKYSNWKLSTAWNYYETDLTGWVEKKQKKMQSNVGDGVMITTGATESSRLQNIYDLAGNVSEWTLEFTNGDTYKCVHRGRYCNSVGTNLPASYREGDLQIASYDNLSFRVSIY